MEIDTRMKRDNSIQIMNYHKVVSLLTRYFDAFFSSPQIVKLFSSSRVHCTRILHSLTKKNHC